MAPTARWPRSGLVILDDPKGVQPIYAPAPVIRADVLARQPQIADLLAPVFTSLDGPTLQALNAQIALEGQDAKKVAEALPEGQGLDQVTRAARAASAGDAARARPHRRAFSNRCWLCCCSRRWSRRCWAWRS